MADAMAEKIGKYRWVICALLFFATTINYLDRNILSILRPVLEKELHWANPNNIEQEYSYIVMAFTIAYASGVLVFGWFVDKVGTKIGYAVSITLWGLSSLSHALARSSFGFGIARIGLGLGESGNFPAAIKTIAEWFPKKERALATGIFNSGTNVGAVVAPLVIPWAIYYFASNPAHPFWQIAFIITGLCDLIWLGFWLAIYKKPADKKNLTKAEYDYIHSDTDEQNVPKEKMPWGKLFSYRQTWAIFIAKVLTDCVWLFFLFWLPAFLVSQGIDMRDFWNFALPLIIIYSMTTVGSISGGWLSSRLIRKGWTINKARKTAMLTFALVVMPIVAVVFVGLWFGVILIGLALASHQAWSANLLTTASDMFPKRAVASVVGIVTFGGCAAAALFQWMTGIILASYRSSANIETGYLTMFVICASMYLIALFLFHLLAPKMEIVREHS